MCIVHSTLRDSYDTIHGTLPTRRRKDSDTENDRNNGLRMKNE